MATLTVVAVGMFFVATSIWVQPQDSSANAPEPQSLGLDFAGSSVIVTVDTPEPLAPTPPVASTDQP